jgi:hypothetical protein
MTKTGDEQELIEFPPPKLSPELRDALWKPQENGSVCRSLIAEVTSCFGDLTLHDILTADPSTSLTPLLTRPYIPISMKVPRPALSLLLPHHQVGNRRSAGT